MATISLLSKCANTLTDSFIVQSWILLTANPSKRDVESNTTPSEKSHQNGTAYLTQWMKKKKIIGNIYSPRCQGKSYKPAGTEPNSVFQAVGGSEVAPTAPVEVREGPTPPSARTHARQNGGRTRGSEWPRPNDANSGPVASRLSSCVPRRTASRGVSEHREQRRPLLQERYFATSRDIMSRCRVCSSFALVNQEPK